jgi:hypothetical protein
VGERFQNEQAMADGWGLQQIVDYEQIMEGHDE